MKLQTPHHSESGRIVRIVTLNIAHGRGLSLYQGLHSKNNIEKKCDRIAEFLVHHHPDIAAFQEADTGSHWNKQINLVEHIRSSAGYPFAEAGIHTVRDTEKPLAYGNAVLSKFPIRWCETFPFGTRTMGEKGFMAADIDAGGIDISIINLHLEYKSRKKRVEQVEMLIAMLESKKKPFPHPIICGDFNSTSKGESDAVRHLFSFMRTFDAYALFPQKASTFPAHFPLRRLDFIMLPSQFKAVHCHVVRSFISDHRPVVLDFEIR